MLALLETLKTSKQQGYDCQAALHILEQRLRRFRSLMHKMDLEQHRDEKAIFNAALYAIFNAIEDFRGRTEREAIAFCRTIVRRTTIRHLRAVTWPTERTDLLEAIPAPGPTSEESLLEEERHQLVHKALALLRPEERVLLERVALHGERIVDIALRSGEAENTLTKRKNRAVRKLAHYLARFGGLEAP